MSNENEEDDIIQYLPALNKESRSKDLNIDDFDGKPSIVRKFDLLNLRNITEYREKGWYENFMSEVKDDVDPQKLHELVVDYLTCCGYQEAAQLLCTDARIKFPLPNNDSLEKRNIIRNSIVTGDLESALRQIDDLAANLLAENSRLHFNLLRQQLVELIRKKNIDKVLSFAQDNLVDKCEQPPELFTKLEQTYALLAFDNPETSPFGSLMSMNQRNMLANEVNAAILSYLNNNPTSKLENLFRIMVWNHNQLVTKGEPISASKSFSPEKAAKVSREIFGTDDDPQTSGEMF